MKIKYKTYGKGIPEDLDEVNEVLKKQCEQTMAEIMRKYVIIYGSLSDGIVGCIGLFDTEEDAERYADMFNLGHYEKIPIQIEEKDSRFE